MPLLGLSESPVKAARMSMAGDESSPAASLFEITLSVSDGVRGLSRVMNVLALLDITPIDLTAVAGDGQVTVTATLAAETRATTLALARLRALPCVRSAGCRSPSV